MRFLHYLSLSVFFSISIYSCSDALDINSDNCESVAVIDNTPNVKSTSKYSFDDIKKLLTNEYNDYNITTIDPFVYNGDTLLYGVNYEKGWKIISADKRTTTVLAYNDEGQLNINDKRNIGFNIWLKDVTSFLTSTIKRPIETKSTDESMWAREIVYSTTSNTITEQVPYLLETEWGQDFPWNEKAPTHIIRNNLKCLTGCVAVAISQVLYYLHFHSTLPIGLYHTITPINQRFHERNYNGTLDYCHHQEIYRSDYVSNSSRWNAMATTMNDIYGNTSYVADLMADVGERVNMHYGTIVSDTELEDLLDALPYYNLSADSTDYSYDLIKDNLRMNIPVISTASNSREGHSWVIDGFKDEVQVRTYQYVWHIAGRFWEGDLFTTQEVKELFPDDKIEDGMTSSETIETQFSYVHMNWGYDGEGDGYYWVDGTWNSYDSNKIIVHNIHPIQ